MPRLRRAKEVRDSAFTESFRLRTLRRDLPSSDYGMAGKTAWQAEVRGQATRSGVLVPQSWDGFLLLAFSTGT
jgi:hypothetical protein